MQSVLTVFDEHLLDLAQSTVDRVRGADLPFYKTVPVEALRASFIVALQALREDLASGTAVAFPRYMVPIAKQRTEQGVDIGQILAVVEQGFAAVSDLLERAFGADLQPRFWWERKKFEIGHICIGQLWDASVAARDEIIRAKTAEIYRLGATIVPLYRGVLLLPVVGTVDAQRAEQILSALLEAIVARQSAVVIVDITGVPMVDTDVVGSFLRAAQATRLLGAEPVLVGMNPGVAQSMVALGVDLAGITVRGTLEDGMSYALRRVGKLITATRPARER